MLKKISRLFLGLVVCASSACVTPTHASSAEALQEVVITQIQASGPFGAKDEYIILHNNTDLEINITDWCLMNKSQVLFACFTPKRTTTIIEQFFVLPYGDIIIASNEQAMNGYPWSQYSLVYEVTNQSSGSLVNSSDTLVLFNKDGQPLDMKAWTSAIPTGKILARMLLVPGIKVYADTDTDSDWTTQNKIPFSSNAVHVRSIPNPNPDEPEPEANPEDEPPTDPSPNQPSVLLPPIITEILANPAGSDTGNEFIELYNPNEHDTISLDDFRLLIGVDSVKTYTFPTNASIPPLGYVAFSNQDIDYTLVNTTGKVQLAQDGVNVGSAVEYTSPKDDYAWVLIDGIWQYTKQASPGAPNILAADIDDESRSSSKTSTAKPCAANQYRNPETGRCKLLSTASSSPTPCKENQVRNLETNRCRNIAATNSPTPCKEGQERNPETNRCRNIVKMSTAGHSVSAESKVDSAMSWYYWAAIIAIILLILSYAVWEWRQELANLWVRVRTTFAKHTD